MIKIRLKRVKHGPYFHTHDMDVRFVNGSVVKAPRKGDRVVFQFEKFDTLDKAWWTTTRVISVSRRKGLTIFNTVNSCYHMKKGWTK